MPQLNIHDHYPPVELRRRHEEIRRFWSGRHETGILYSTWTGEPWYRNLDSPEECVESFLKLLRIESELPGCNFPAFFPDMGATMVASAFGGKIRRGEGQIWTEPVISRPEDVNNLSSPSPTDGRIGEGLRRYEMVLECTEGPVYLRPPDLQGPLSTSSLLWQQEAFLMAMHQAPEAVHRTLEVVTDLLIRIIRHMREEYEHVIEPFWPLIAMPPEVGCSITEDFMPLVSAEMYREFGLPYTRRLAEEFGGVYIHCCGNWRQHLPTFAEQDWLRGMDIVSPESDPDEVFGHLPPRVAFTWGVSSRGEVQYPTQSALLEHLLETAPPDRRFFFMLCADDPEELQRNIDLIESARTDDARRIEWPR